MSHDQLNKDLCFSKLCIDPPATCHLLGCSNEGGDKKEGQEAVDYAVKVHEKIHRQALRLPGVNAVDVGFAAKGGAFENTLAIRLHVTKKKTKEELREEGHVSLTDPCYAEDYRTKAGADPCQAKLEKSGFDDDIYEQYPILGVHKDDLSCCQDRLCICGVPLDIISARYFPAAGVFVEPPKTSRELGNKEALRTGSGRIEPLVGGVSVGSVSGQAGTLGIVAWDRTDRTPCLVGNWHVLAGPSAAVGQPCYQPALFDGGTEADAVGHLKRWYIGELGDAAIAELDGTRDYASGEILGMWHPIAGHRAPRLNLEIRKWGRTTGFTEGFIDGVHLATNVDYGRGVVRYFRDQFHIAPLKRGENVSQTGDSGSLVLWSLPLGEDFDRLPDECSSDEGRDQECEQDKFEVIKEKIEEILQEGLGFEVEFVRKALREELAELGIDLDDIRNRKELEEWHRRRRVYFAVGMIFAGDTAGSPFGEFALASDVEPLAKELDVDLRPVFEPRGSLRKVRSLPEVETGARGGGRGLAPQGLGRDPRGRGPQPDPEPKQTDPDG